jgi:hypothetical protein
MANDGGLIAALVQWVADTLKILAFDGKLVFKTVDIWKHQVGISKSGLEASSRYSPFAFVSSGDEKSKREGGYELQRIPDIRIVIGVDSKEDGVAQWGDETHFGTSKIRDLVINALDKKRPDGTDITCDEFYYENSLEILDMPKCHWLQINFTVGQMTETED